MYFTDDVVVIGLDGRRHIASAKGKTKVRPPQVYLGKVGQGLSVEIILKHSPVKLLSVVEAGDGKILLLVTEGELVITIAVTGFYRRPQICEANYATMAPHIIAQLA